MARSQTWILVVAAWCLCLPKMIPGLSLDRGIFVSVGERLLAGDRLYAQVWDNKDPLFYYGVALARAVSPIGDVVLEALWVLLAALAVRRCASLAGLDAHWSRLTGFALTPLLLTGGLVEPGYSHLPGVAATMFAFASAFAGRWARAGASVGVLLLLKLVMAPVAVLPILAIVFLRRDRRPIVPALIGFCAALVAGLTIVQLRGELVPYLQALQANLSYSQSSLLSPGLPSPIAHLARVATPRALVTTSAIVAVVVWQARSGADGEQDREPRRVLWWGALLSLLGAVVVLAATGLWPQHDQILLVPASFAMLLVATRAPRLLPRTRGSLRTAVALVLVVASTILVSDPAPNGYAQAFTQAPERLQALSVVSPEAQALRSTGVPASYARVGQNDDRGHAYGLREWRLACPRFHQYPFDPPSVLAATAECLPSAHYVIVAASAAPEPGAAAWNAYLREVRATLQDDFTCRTVDGVEVCARRGV